MQSSGSNEMTLPEAVLRYAKLLTGQEQVSDGRLHGLLTRTTEYLRGHGLDKLIAEQYQLGFVNPARKADESYAGYLVIPYNTPAGGIKGVRYRCVQPHDCKLIENHSKYTQPVGQPLRLFNPHAFFSADDVIGIAEGEIDAIAATEVLGIPTIGIPGVESWHPNQKVWRRCFDDYNRIVIFVDRDDKPTPQWPKGPGLGLAEQIQIALGGDRCLLVLCDKGDDVSSMIANGKADILRERAGIGGSMG